MRNTEKAVGEQVVTEYAAFDLLRFILASVVVLIHMFVITTEHVGPLAVEIFFALSGWLIGGILLRTEPGQLPRFYYARVTRVWIPYFLAVLAVYLLGAARDGLTPRWGEFLAYDLSFTHNWFTLWPDKPAALAQMPLGATGGHFWSLAVEEQFYLVAPLLITVAPFGKKLSVWCAIAAAAYFSHSQYAAISFGVLAALLHQRYGPWHSTRGGTFWLLGALCAAGLAMACVEGAYYFTAPLVAVCTVLLCARQGRRTAFSRYLGGVSFPLYLNQWVGFFALHALEKQFDLGPAWCRVLLGFALALAFATLAYYLVDRPVMARRAIVYQRRLGLAAGAAGYVLVLSGTLYGLAMAAGRL